jgi:aspartate racemase
METSGQMRPFGLVAGLGMGAGIFYYKALVEGSLARGLTLRLLMVHADVRYVISRAAARATQELAEYLAGLLQQLAQGGAEIASIPAFTPQICAAELASITPLPLISLLDAITAEIERRRFHRVALFGGRVTMETRMFGCLGETEVILATAEEMDTIAAIYTRVVEAGSASDQDFNRLRSLAHTLIERERLDGIVLAGTDLAFVFNPGNTDFPHIDGARIHIDAILREIAPAPAAAQGMSD